MVNFVSIGSCLTGHTGAFLRSEYKWTRVNTAKVDRSDHFLDDFIVRSGNMPSSAEISSFTVPLPDHVRDFKENLDACYPETIGLFACGDECVPLQKNLESGTIDLILMDNLSDTHLHTLELDAPSGRRFRSTLPFHLCSNKDEIFARNAIYRRPLTAAESVENWLQIVDFFRKTAPNAAILFICSPYVMSGANLDRYRRSRDFYTLFKAAATERNVKLIPPLDVERQYTKLPHDEGHFNIVIYKAMAGFVVLTQLAKLPGIGQPYMLPPSVVNI